MIEDMISRAFAARNAAHLTHWKTKSYAVHAAAGSFYESIPGLVDAIVEAYQGNFDPVGDVDLEAGDGGGELLAKLERDAVWLDKNRTKIAGGVRAIENLVDALTETYLSTIYKLRNLS